MDQVEGARAIAILAKKAELLLTTGEMDEDAEAALRELLSHNHYFIKRQAAYRNVPFLLPAHLLDTTQPSDFDYGTPEWRVRWEKRGKTSRLNPIKPGHNLSCSRNLGADVLAQYVLFSFRKNYLGFPPNPFGIVPEVSWKGHRRCIYVRGNGMRCLRYSSSNIICNKHGHLAAMKDLFGNSIKNQSLKEYYLNQLNNPDYKNAQSELAILRTILGSMIGKLDGTHKDMLYFENIMQLCKVVTSTVETITTIETKNNMRLSMDQLQNLIESVVGVVVKIMEPDDTQLLRLADGIEGLKVFRTDMGNTKMLTFGMDQPKGPVKKTTALDAFTPEGIIKNSFTEEQVTEQKAYAQEGYREAKAAQFATRVGAEDISEEFALDGVPF